MRTVSRRQVLAASGGLSALGVAGCTALRSGTDSLTLILLNFDSEPHTLDVELTRPNADRYTEAVALQEQYDLEALPEGAAAAEHREPDVLENDTYQVWVHLMDAPQRAGLPALSRLSGRRRI